MSTPDSSDLPSPPPVQRGHEAFQNTPELKDLGGRAVSGGFFTAGAQGLRFALYMASTIVLARLLSKEDFGLVAMVGALISFLRIFREAGLSTATQQKERITHAQVSNLFWLNVALGVLAATVGSALSPAVAWFFRDQRLIKITIGLALTFIFSGSSVQHLALLTREMRFRSLAMIDVGSVLLGAIVGVVMAMTGCGYWSLVFSQMTTSLTEMLLAWTFSHWRPQLPRRGSDTRSMIRFGASLTFSTLIRRLTGGVDTMIIGRYYGAGPLGLYSRSGALLIRPLDQLILPFDIVFIPILSRLQDQPDRFNKTYLQVFRAIALISFPLGALMLALGRPLVLLMLGTQWEQVAPIFAAMAISAFNYPIVCSTVWLPTTQGRNKDIVSMGIIRSIVPVVSYFVGLPFGVAGVALASSLAGLFVTLPLLFRIAGRAGPVTTGDLWKVFLQFLPLWAVVGGGVYGCLCLLPPSVSPLMQLIYCTPVGLILAAAVICIVPVQLATARKVMHHGFSTLGTFLQGRKPA